MKSMGLIVALLVAWASTASAVIIIETVNGASGPWWWVNGGLNTAYQYANEYGNSDIAQPTVISATDGFNFSAGLSLTISYVSGGVENSWGGLPVDANGIITFPMNNILAGSYGPAPSYYMSPATYPIYNAELVGTFANSSGQIVGTPFAIGNSKTVTVPIGATRLELGVNDNNYGDNSGSWNIQIAQVPEPTTDALALLGAVALLGGMRLRRRSS